MTHTLSETIASSFLPDGHAPVVLNHGLITLLSEQLYKSPVKAIEELVVNAFDADASLCHIALAAPADLAVDEHAFVLVFDNGAGMDAVGLADLWHIGSSPKTDPEYRKRFKRRFIGKFGIGKLASYAIAHRLTYITRKDGVVRAVTIDFHVFSQATPVAPTEVQLPIRRVDTPSDLFNTPALRTMLAAAHVSEELLSGRSWTIAILEELKPKASEIQQGRLRWVLSTAMPLRSDFKVLLNGEDILSTKEEFRKAVEFSIADLPEDRLANLQDKTGMAWRIDAQRLKSDSFPEGIAGSAYITDRSLKGKSDDLHRSYGFFVRVRGRLVNLDDALFGLEPLSHEYFNSFRADIDADDLHPYLLSSREEFENAEMVRDLRAVLHQVFNEARARKMKLDQSLFGKEQYQRESVRSYIEPRLVPRPIADVLATDQQLNRGSEATDEWFYLRVPNGVIIGDVIQDLYKGTSDPFQYTYEPLGDSKRMVHFHVKERRFALNQDHQLVRAYQDVARRLLEDVVTAEAMLEVYLREASISPATIGDILQRRDELLRGLAKDHSVSLSAIAADLRDSAANERDLEVSLVRCARALGFVATQVSGSGEPDGIARWLDYRGGRERKITLEAKSSSDIPSLSSIDSSGISQHMRDKRAEGCMVVAPGYPGTSEGNESAIAKRSIHDRFSCWTAEDLARVVEQAESRHITAEDILRIVTSAFSPHDVHLAVEGLLSDPNGDRRALSRAILAEFRSLQGKAIGSVRSVDMLLGRLVDREEFVSLEKESVRKVLAQMAGASKGAITLSGDDVILLTSLEELERRLSSVLSVSGVPRGRGSFRADNRGDEVEEA